MNQPALYVTLCGPDDNAVAEIKINIPSDDWRDEHLASIQLHGNGTLDTKNWIQQNRMLAARRAYLARLTDRINRELTKALAGKDKTSCDGGIQPNRQPSPNTTTAT